LKPAAITRDTATGRPSAPTIAALAGAIAALFTGTAAAQATGLTLPIERPILTPGLHASATWSDNVGLSENNGSSDLVLEASPYITAQSFAPRARYDVFYQLRNFWRMRDGDSNLYRHALNANGSFALVEDRLWLDLAGYMGTISTSAAGPITIDPAASFANTANVRSFTVSPWYRDRLGSLAGYELRYALTHSGGSSDFAVANLRHRASASIDGLEGRFSPWNWRAHSSFERREFDHGLELDRRDSGAMLYYRVNPGLRVYGAVDYEQIDEVRNHDGDNSGYGPGAGFDWTPNPRTNVAMSVSHRYYGTIGNARAAYTTARSTTGIEYSRSILTSAESSLLMLDPARLTAIGATPGSSVLANLIASGVVLPVGTALTQGLFTDSAVLDRRLTAFWGLHGVRNSLALSAWVSTRESPAGLAAAGGFAGELRQRGAAATYRHRLDARSAVDFTLDRRNSRSPTGDFETRLTTLRAGYFTRLTRDTDAFAGYRHTRQSGSGTGASYDENAIYGGFDMRFR
jgi:uncharacterized protein (PEP-CTERM system associated)